MPSLYDFIGLSDPLDDVGLGRRYRNPVQQPLAPEVENSLLSNLAGGGLSALGFVGNVLDTPGAFVRTALAGENPFPGIFDTSQRVGGRDLLEQYGILGSNTPGLDFGDVAGFAAEVGLDPLTYLSFGASALTKAGKAADAAGTLAKATYGAGGELLQGARAAGIEAGQRGLVGFGLPFMDNAAAFGTGKAAQAVGGALDTAEHWARFGNPVGRAIGGIFDPSVHDALTQSGQVAMRELDPQLQAAEAAARMRLAEHAQTLRGMGYLGSNPLEASQFRAYMEGTAPLAQEFAQAQPTLDLMRSDLDTLLTNERSLAMQTPELTDQFAKYVPRQRTEFAVGTGAGGRMKGFPTEHPFQIGREEFLKNIPGGTETINKMSLDPQLSGAASQPILDRIKAVKQTYGVADDGQAKDLAEWLGSLPADHLQKQMPVFGNHPVYDILKRFTSSSRSQAAVSGLYDFLGKNIENVRSADNVHVGDVLAGAGLDRGRALFELAARFPNADIARSFVPKEIAGDVSRFIKGFSSPEPANLVISAVDKFTNAFKVSALSRPSRLVRDLYSGQYMNWVTGLFSRRSLTGAGSILTQGLDAVVPGAEQLFKGMTPKQATQELVKELFAHKIVQPFGGEFADLSKANVSGSKLLNEIPGGVPQTMKGTFVEPFTQEGALNPLRVRGVGKPGQVVNESQFAPVKISENVSHFTDGLNRIAPYIEGRLQGMSPEVVARKVKLAQVDYSRLTNTERSVLKRVIPFYSFTRRMVPQVFQELIEKPGGRLAQTIRAENASRDDQFLPPYLAPGLAIRLPDSLGPDNGDTRYLTSIDLPHESVMQLFRPSNTALGTFAETGMGLLGQLNPLLKAPMELATGKQFYSGRDLADLDSRIGRVFYPDGGGRGSILLDQAAMNLPVVSPLLTTVGTIADPRKGWGAVGVNMLSGAKLSDVDVEKSRDRIARDAIEEMMQGNPAVSSYTTFSVPRDKLDTLSPEDQLLMQEYNAIRNRARERAQQRNAGAGRL